MAAFKIVSLLMVIFVLLQLTCAYLATTSNQVNFPVQQKQQKRQQRQRQRQKGDNCSGCRRRFLEQVVSISFGVAALPSSPAVAAEEIVLPTKETVTNTFEPIKKELQSPEGGVSYMQSRIDAQDFTGLLEFTKTYDLELRKLRMGKAKKLMQSKESKEKATSYANAVTFDLIGINRNCRQGQESVEGANKYLQELRDDVAAFLALESTIETQG